MSAIKIRFIILSYLFFFLLILNNPNKVYAVEICGARPLNNTCNIGSVDDTGSTPFISQDNGKSALNIKGNNIFNGEFCLLKDPNIYYSSNTEKLNNVPENKVITINQGDNEIDISNWVTSNAPIEFLIVKNRFDSVGSLPDECGVIFRLDGPTNLPIATPTPTTPVGCVSLSQNCISSSTLCDSENHSCDLSTSTDGAQGIVKEKKVLTPAPINIDITAPELHNAKCGLKEAGYQCCYPNLKRGSFSLKGTFFELFESVWTNVQSFINTSVDDYFSLGTSEINETIFNSDNKKNLCPRSEEGPRKQRFVNLSEDNWLDKNEKYDGNPDENGQIEIKDNEELKNYSNFLTGGDVSNTGLINAFFTQEILPTGGVSYEGNNYACFCVNIDTEMNSTPQDFLNLSENSSLNSATNSNQLNQSNLSLKKSVAGVGSPPLTPAAMTGADKLCRNISTDYEREKCKQCVSGKNDTGEIVSEAGGAWTALGCINANFSDTLQVTLFPLFISFGGIISLGCIIYASFLLQTSMGEPEKIGKAQELMTSCITGLIMIIFSIFILRVIGFDILRLPGFGDEASSPTPTSTSTPTPTSTSTPTPTSTSTPTPTSTSTPTQAPTPTPATFELVQNPVIYNQNGSIFIFSDTNNPVTVNGIYQNGNYVLYQLQIDDKGVNFYTRSEFLQTTPTPSPSPISHPFKCEGSVGQNDIFIYDDINQDTGACAKLTLNDDGSETVFDLSKLKHDEMNDDWWRRRCDDNFEDCIASFKLGSGVEVELYKERCDNPGNALTYAQSTLTIIDNIDQTRWPSESYTDSVSCIKLNKRQN